MNGERRLLWLFDAGLVLKAIDGSLEMLGAFLILLVPPTFIVRVVEMMTAGEVASDPDDPIANALRDAAHSFAIHTHYLIALYLIIHGAVKVFLVLAIFAKKPYAYPLFIIALGLFSSYEAYRFVVTSNLVIGAAAAFDFALMLLAGHEFRARSRALIG